jgi:hypothetical protein
MISEELINTMGNNMKFLKISSQARKPGIYSPLPSEGQSPVWKSLTSPKDIKLHQNRSKMKVTWKSFCDWQITVLHKLVDEGATVNEQRYKIV